MPIKERFDENGQPYFIERLAGRKHGPRIRKILIIGAEITDGLQTPMTEKNIESLSELFNTPGMRTAEFTLPQKKPRKF